MGSLTPVFRMAAVTVTHLRSGGNISLPVNLTTDSTRNWVVGGVTLGLTAGILQILAGLGLETVRDRIQEKRRKDNIKTYIRNKKRKSGKYDDEVDIDKYDSLLEYEYDYGDYSDNDDSDYSYAEYYSENNTGFKDVNKSKIYNEEIHKDVPKYQGDNEVGWKVRGPEIIPAVVAARIRAEKARRMKELQLRLLMMNQKAALLQQGKRVGPNVPISPGRPKIVQGYLRTKLKHPGHPRVKIRRYGYLRPKAREYYVSYPYGLGGDTILDRVSVKFDNWVTSAIIGYFFNRPSLQ